MTAGKTELERMPNTRLNEDDRFRARRIDDRLLQLG